MRPQTVIDLAPAAGLHLPSTDAADLGQWFPGQSTTRSLVDYLRSFDVTTAVMRDAAGLERVAREYVQDVAADGVVYGEVRWAPEQSATDTLSMDEAVQDVLAGLGAGAAEVRAAGGSTRVTLPLCAMRQDDRSKEVAELALRHRSTDGLSGVVGFELLCNADAAMYEAKRAGGGGRQVRVYDTAAASRAQRAAELAHDITAAVQRGQVHVAYQPVWDLIADRPVGVEALARWTHPVHGVVGPDVFPQAERNGAIIGIGHQMLRTALVDLRTWDAPGRAELTVSVNASPVELADEGYADRVLGELAAAGVAPQRLLIEITEGLPLVEASLDQLARLRRSGVRVVVDDFGISHSDLARLKHLRVDGLKIDKSLADGLSTEQDADPMDVGILSAVLALARPAGLSVVAEGVGSPAQRSALVALGCSLAQGWLMSRPLPATQLQELLAGG